MFKVVAVLFMVLGLAAGWTLLAIPEANAQSSVSAGGILGTVLDQNGGAIAGAKVTISNKATGASQTLESNSTGGFNAGNLSPATYIVRIEASNFNTFQSSVVVQVGQITTVNAKLEVGASATTVEVNTSAVSINSVQATVQDVLTAKDIDQLPVNGRNFLDLATLEPGVQIQDGATFDPTKNGYSSLSFGGRFGRTARIEVDGVDISDETVGTTTQNIPQSAIAEFQVASSSLDLSTELTSSGTVNVVTKSGTNDWHGQAFYYGRSDQTSARIGPPGEYLPFGRKQFGADLGSALVKNKLFFYGDFERTDQSLDNPVTFGPPFDPANPNTTNPFSGLSGSYNSPFFSRAYLGRVDYNIRPNWTAFYRFTYDQNLSVRGFNPGVYQPFQNVDHTRAHVVGTDFSFGRSTNSIRFEWLKFHNEIVNGVALSGALDPVPGISLDITPSGSDVTCLAGGETFCSGANILAPQQTYQEDRQIKYDGSYTIGSHTLRYGGGYNGILGGGFAKFFALQPVVLSLDDPANRTVAAAGPFPGGVTNPLNWPVTTTILGNGQGFSTERPGFGLPAGGQYDHRMDFYVGDQWKLRSNLTVTLGLHYGRDTGRTDSDLPSIAGLSVFNNQFFNNLQDRVNQPNKNFGPQIGIAWDPWKNGKTVFRVGGGLYYENAIFNNVLFDRPGRLTTGLFLAQGVTCSNGKAVPTANLPAGVSPPTYCGQPLGSVDAAIASDQTAYQAAILAAGPSTNPNNVANNLFDTSSEGVQLLAPDYVSPRSVQMNFGVQRQLSSNTTISIDYVRNVGTHFLLAVDTNKSGDARFLNTPNALAAISATNQAAGCGPGTDAASINCAIGKGATIASYAANGLDSTGDFTGNFGVCSTCAFAGINPNVGQNQMLFPIGRSVYNGLLVELKSNLNNPLPGVRRMNLIASYTLSRYVANGDAGGAGDGDFVNNAFDFNNPLKAFGPNGLDRTHLVSVGAVLDLPWATRLGLTSHYSSAAPLTLTLPQAGAPGEIFRTDVTGDGTVGDILPGTNVGSFGRSVKAGGLNNVISAYNSNDAGKLTPAGQALVAANLFTQAQLVSLGAVTPTLALAPAGQVGMSPLFTFDAHVSWEIKLAKVMHFLPERVILEPQIALYNLFNFHNYDPFGNEISGVLNGSPGSANGTTRGDRAGALITPGSSSGVNWYAVPRQAEFGVKFNF
jgi:hypothetical protein